MARVRGFLASFNAALEPVALLDRFQIAGALVTWSCGTQSELAQMTNTFFCLPASWQTSSLFSWTCLRPRRPVACCNRRRIVRLGHLVGYILGIDDSVVTANDKNSPLQQPPLPDQGAIVPPEFLTTM